MQLHVDQKVINVAFELDAHLKKRVWDAINESPQHAQLFEDIATYHEIHRSQSATNGADVEKPVSKKRKLANGVLPIMRSEGNQEQRAILEVKDVSFSIPQRKKLHLEIVQHGRGREDLGDPPPIYTICTRNPASYEYESAAPLDGFGHILRLPVPEKAQKQYNFCLLPSSGLLPGENTAQGGSASDPIIWTVNDGGVKSYNALEPLAKILELSEKIFDDSLEFAMRLIGTKVTYPDEAEFVSAIPESHRKGEKAYHVKAFRGSKDGFLFFLKDGVFFGFKKPLLFFPFDSIESTSYTSVLQRTFNLNIAYKTSADGEPEEVEFSMIDQAHFGGIDAYLKKHQLQDASMAEARRAKKSNVNGGKKGVINEDDVTGDEPTELQKAEQDIEDEEDEEEEDYDPGSDGESEGSGSDSEENEEDGYVSGGDRHDLVEDELGSEAEEVEPESDDEDRL